MFCGMSLGVLMYAACDRVRDKTWSGGFKALLAIIQIFCTALVMIRTWISATSPLYGYLDFGWGVTFLISTIFTFLRVFSQDYFTRLPIFANKIWNPPAGWPCTSMYSAAPSSSLLWGTALARLTLCP